MTENLVLALDPDEAGIKAAGRAARAALASGLNVKVAQLPNDLDPADLIKQKGAETWKEAIKNAKDIITFLLDVLQAHAKSPDQFRRNVEAVVLPFLSDIQSPIAREQSGKEIAKRLGVSEAAVQDALAKIPLAPVRDADRVEVQNIKESFRAKNAFAILVWQESLVKSKLDTKELAAELQEAIGEEAFAALRKLPENEQEHLRFSAERLYGVDRSPREDFQHLTRVLARARLTAELADVTAALRRTEATGETGESERLLEESKLLTDRIAQLLKIE
jgi:DNA primase